MRYTTVFPALGLLIVAGSVSYAQSVHIKDYVASKLDDFTSTMKVTQHDDNAGRLINKDFGLMYKIKGDIALQYKDENKLRLDGTIGSSRATLIVNGTKQIVRIPGLGLNKTDDLGETPGKRKTLLDMGMISDGYLAYTLAEFRRMAPVEGRNCAVFKISYRNKDLDTSHRIVWIDPKTKVTLKREEYNQEGKLNATFFYKNPTEIAPGIWFPTSIEVQNNKGQKAGTTLYKNVKVNQNLNDSVFK